VALLLAGEDRALLERVARAPDERGGHPVASEARARAERALLGQAKQPDASAATLAEAARLSLRRGDRPGAIQFLRRATTIEYAALDWRLDLARALAAEGHVDQAIDEARNVLRQAPAHAVAKQLLDEWRRSATRPATQRAPATAPATPAGFKLD
jgi:tetratricopeptide (TPR) repeat protein